MSAAPFRKSTSALRAASDSPAAARASASEYGRYMRAPASIDCSLMRTTTERRSLGCGVRDELS